MGNGFPDVLNISAVKRIALARVAVSAYFFVSGALFASWVAHIPFVQTKLGLTEGAIGLIFLAKAGGALFSMPAAGWLAGRIGSMKVLLFAAVPYCLCLPLLLIARSTEILAFTLFCFGALGGAMNVSMNAQGVSIERVLASPIMSSLHGLWSVGGLAGALAAGTFLASGFSPQVHVCIAALTLLLIVLAASGFLLKAEEEPVIRAKTDAGHIPSLRERLSGLANSVLLALGVFAFLDLMAEGAMADWSAVYLRDHLRATAALAATGYGAFSLSMAAGRFIGDRLVRRWGRVRVLRIGTLIAAAGLFSVSFAPHPMIAIVGFGLVGLGLSNGIPILFSAAGFLPGMNPGQSIATVTTTGYFGLLIGPPLIGFLAEWSSLSSAISLLAGLVFTCALFAGIVKKKEVRVDKQLWMTVDGQRTVLDDGQQTTESDNGNRELAVNGE